MSQPQDIGARPLALPLYQGSPHPCPYLSDRTAVYEFTKASTLDSAVYQQLMDMGFRRSGHVVYRPVCDACRECVPIRVPVDRFDPSRSQRRVLRKNHDVQVEFGPPIMTDEKWRVYSAFQARFQDGAMSDSRKDLEDFLYTSPTTTEETTYRAGGRIVAVGIVDVCPSALSSVYFYFDPIESRRSLGVFGALVEIEECRRRGLPFWYAGYYVRDCRRMNYKAQFRPHELLGLDGRWLEESASQDQGPVPQ